MPPVTTPPPNPAPDPAVEAFARNLRDCLDAKDPVAALLAFLPELQRTAGLPRVAVRLSEHGAPHPLTGIGLLLVSGALAQSGRGLEIVPLLTEISDLFAPPHRHYAPGSNLSDILSWFPFLNVPLIKGSVADKEQLDAVSLCLRFAEHASDVQGWIFGDLAVAHVLAHPAAPPFGPFRYDRAWVLGQQEAIRALGTMNGSLERVVEFDQLYLENALLIEQPARGLPILGPGGTPDAAFLARAHHNHLGFNAVCVLAALKRHDDALTLARHMVRRGYSLRWRFNLETAAKMDWTQRMRQNEWLAALSQTPAYQAFLAMHVQYCHADEKDPTQTALCSVREGTWGGKKKTKCFISKAAIQPGDPINRVRRMRGLRAFDDFDIASKAGLAAAPWQSALHAFETNTVPLQRMFGPPGHTLVKWDDPEISAFHADTVSNPASVDITRAVAILGAHNPPPIRRSWTKGPDRKTWFDYAFDPWAGDDGHGKPLSLVWCLIKAGYRDQVLAEASRLPRPEADKVFAMLATFDEPIVRSAAAKHFKIPELPAMMETVFSSRLTLDQHIAVAGFGREHPRFRAGLAVAMRSYGLHLYSNYHPTADWCLADLEHYSMAKGCQLLMFLIHHPEDDEVLAEMIPTGWLPGSIGAGAFDAYGNSAHYYYRAASLHIALDQPERFPAWIARPWIKERLTTAVDRETFRLLEKLEKLNAKKTAKTKAP